MLKIKKKTKQSLFVYDQFCKMIGDIGDVKQYFLCKNQSSKT
jgi:hypothetical protein